MSKFNILFLYDSYKSARTHARITNDSAKSFKRLIELPLSYISLTHLKYLLVKIFSIPLGIHYLGVFSNRMSLSIPQIIFPINLKKDSYLSFTDKLSHGGIVLNFIINFKFQSMKKTFYALLAMVFIFTSCSNEEIVNDQLLSSSEGRLVTFSLGLPSREPVTYAQVHEQDEYKIDRLDIYQFNSSGLLVKIFDNVTTNGAATSTNPAIRTVAQIELSKNTTGVQDFLFVTNNNGSKMQDNLLNIPLGTSKDVLKEKLTQMLPAANAKLNPSFLMTGEKSVNVTAGSSLNLTNSSDIVYLTRIVARIDIGVSLKTSAEQLTITKVELKDAPKYSYLFKKGLGESPSNSGKVTYAPISATSSPNLQSHFDGVSTSSYASRYKKLFYLYERQQTEFASKGTPTLYISGQYKKDASSAAVEVNYVVSFGKDVKRNYLYTVVLGVKPSTTPGGGTGSGSLETSYEIKTLKWEEEVTVDTDPVKLFTFTPKAGANFTYDNDSRTLVLNTSGASTFDDAFTVTSNYANDNEILDVVKSGSGTLANPNNDWISATSKVGKITLTVEANTTGSVRRGVIWFKSKKDATNSQLYGITVVQPK